MFKKILLPTDESDYANQEIDRVTNLIDSDGEIIILSVVSELDSSIFQSKKHVAEVNEGMINEAIDNVNKMKAKFPEGYNIKTIVKTGAPAETINDVAKDIGVELIVISSSGKSGIQKFIIGSVSEMVLKTAEVDVLLVHNK